MRVRTGGRKEREEEGRKEKRREKRKEKEIKEKEEKKKGMRERGKKIRLQGNIFIHYGIFSMKLNL
jgi:hypothetical protein